MSLTRDHEFWAAFQNHAAITARAAKLLTEMLEQPARREHLANELRDLEHAGDKITHDTVLALHQTWITPLDRDEIHSLISCLDDVLDYIDAAGDRVALYQIQQTRPEALETANIAAAASLEIAKAVELLADLKDTSPLLAICRRINRHEHAADQIFRRALARLFRDEKDPLEVMKWRDILEAVEMAVDKIEDVANIIEGIVLEHG